MSSIKEDIKKICKNIKWWNSSHYILFVLESILTSSIKHILFVLIYDGLITVIFKSWSSNTLATECEEPIHWKRSWYRERLRAEGEGDDSRWDGWMASPTLDMTLSKLQEIMKDREAWRAAVPGVTKSWTWLSDWATTTTTTIMDLFTHVYNFSV